MLFDAPQGLVLWNGVKAVLSGNFVLTAGVSPNQAVIYMAPQREQIAGSGVLALQYGSESLLFPDCVVSNFDMTRDDSGREMWRLEILDGRWRWRFGRISGWYNRHMPDDAIDKVDKATVKTARQLVEILLKAIDVKKVNLSAIPNDAFPLIEWDYAAPDIELSSLLEKFGCRLTYGPGGFVKIEKVTIGAPLPNLSSVMSESFGIDPAERPDELVFIGGPDEYQVDLLLEPYGRELNGELKSIFDLSYLLEVEDWQRTVIPPYYFAINDKVKRELARSCVWKWYRVKFPIQAFLHKKGKIGDFDVPTLLHILPLRDYQLQKATYVGEERRERFMDQWVYGQWEHGAEDAELSIRKIKADLPLDMSTLQKCLYTHGFSVDAEHGMVRFSEPVYSINRVIPDHPDTWKIVPATMYLRTSVSIRDKDRGWIHREVKRKMAGKKNGTRPKYIQQTEVSYKEWVEIKTQPAKTATNDKEFTAAAKMYLDAEEQRLQIDTPQTRQYAGFVRIVPDGAVQQVRWWVDESGHAYTEASRNIEKPHLSMTYKDKLFYEKAAQAFKEAQAAQQEKSRNAERRSVRR